ncbi:MAG: hypothetical protein IPM64_01145 [Phycisphaerales bacterium]|nr:hypothetical protein [Phycisphaerales bacterium]
MAISSRTPEGHPSRCSLCGTRCNLEYSAPLGDAACPSCGVLLWFSTEVLAPLRSRLAQSGVVLPDEITTELRLAELFDDSLDQVEFLVALDGEIGVEIPDEATEQFQTVGDVIRYLQKNYRRE